MASSLFPRQLAGLSRNTFLLAGASLFSDVSTEMLYPVLPVFLIHTLAASGSVVGLVDGFAQASQNLMQGFSGTVSDRLRKHKSIALAGYLLAAVAKPLMGAASSWPALLAARCLDRLGAGIRSAPRDALIAASAHADSRGRAFGLEGVGDNVGACLGPLLAAYLLYSLHLGLRPIFFLATVPGLLAFLMVLLVRERPGVSSAKSRIDGGWRRFPGAYWRYLLVIASFGLGNSSNAFLILRAQDAGSPLPTTMLIYAAFNLVAALVSYPAGSLSDRWGRRNVLLAAFGVFPIAYLGFAVTTSLPFIALAFLVYGIYQGAFRAVGKSLAADLVPAELRASGLGWYGATVGGLQLIASLVAGLLWDRVSHAAVFYYGALCALFGAGALLLIMVPAAAGGAAEARS